ncbi:hypothetical protein C8F01DRAFT_1285978 [Mycena amicta]|nr:hypothetical protein C8F01DRAFT_1285978 [Mycena amicta]
MHFMVLGPRYSSSYESVMLCRLLLLPSSRPASPIPIPAIPECHVINLPTSSSPHATERRPSSSNIHPLPLTTVNHRTIYNPDNTRHQCLASPIQIPDPRLSWRYPTPTHASHGVVSSRRMLKASLTIVILLKSALNTIRSPHFATTTLWISPTSRGHIILSNLCCVLNHTLNPA